MTAPEDIHAGQIGSNEGAQDRRDPAIGGLGGRAIGR
jgi:hypothetical protein